ncbi:transposase [Peribacillus asahii]|uniref:transposase n=1 Tax=Peribacillus asahii TaxID=228899 RepID=UPI00207A3956|nr:transposase [Peribacillus asahii]USK62476.1 transposase [Peribacillus asahii]
MTILSKHNSNQRDQMEIIALDQLVPRNHLVCKIEVAIDFSFIYELAEDMYSSVDRPSINLVILIKLPFIQYTFGICSTRRTIEQVEINMAYQ